MTDSPPDDARLGATEARMRRALGLQVDGQMRSVPSHATNTANGSHLQRRRFVQDGQVPVTVIHRDHRPDETPGTNQLEAARQAIRTEIAARERAERLLTEAHATIRDLQTKLAHERLAKDEAVQRADAEKLASDQALQAVRAELASERLARQKAEAVGSETVVASAAAEPAIQDEVVVPTVRRPVGRPRKVKIATPAAAEERKVRAKPSRPAKPGTAKPIRWWLQGR